MNLYREQFLDSVQVCLSIDSHRRAILTLSIGEEKRAGREAADMMMKDIAAWPDYRG